eukprot:m.66052 g.66052  ORF g.66052 m.66052 type:complete len:153 (-) comp14035_c0_seq1:911-1369(-)
MSDSTPPVSTIAEDTPDLAISGTASAISPHDDPHDMYDTWASTTNRSKRALAGARAEFVNRVIGREVLTELCDGRLVLGQLQCTDKDMNLVIQSANEYRKRELVDDNTTSDNELTTSKAEVLNHKGQDYLSVRFLGVVSIPGHKLMGISVKS